MLRRAAIEVRPPRGAPGDTAKRIRELARRHEGAYLLRIMVPVDGRTRTITLAEEVEPSMELIADLRVFGDVTVLNPHGDVVAWRAVQLS